MPKSTLITALLLSLAIGRAEGAVIAESGFATREAHFSSQVSNIELVSDEMLPDQPNAPRVTAGSVPGSLWFGRIRRRLRSDPIPGTAHDVLFAATYEEERPTTLWCDQNLNGKLLDDPPIHLYPYPEPAGARAGLIDLTWSAAPDQAPVQWKVRIVLEPVDAPGQPPRFRVQKVFAMVGELRVDGAMRKAFLFDGNSDGIYSTEYGDGLFVDLNGDGRIVTDTSSEDFLPFAVPTQIGGTLFRVLRVSEGGEIVTLEARENEKPLPPLTVGGPAPEFQFEALDGRTIHLAAYRGHRVVLYFWASWCGSCSDGASELRSLYDRFHPDGLEVLGISFDRERDAAVEFVTKHREPWPTSFLGHGFWENPIGRQYRVATAGSAYLIDPQGILVGSYPDLGDLEAALSGPAVKPLRFDLK